MNNPEKSHSLQAYIQRRTTAELETALKFYLQEKNWENYQQAIEEILLVLESRYSPSEMPPDIIKARKEFLNRLLKNTTRNDKKPNS